MAKILEHRVPASGGVGVPSKWLVLAIVTLGVGCGSAAKDNAPTEADANDGGRGHPTTGATGNAGGSAGETNSGGRPGSDSSGSGNGAGSSNDPDVNAGTGALGGAGGNPPDAQDPLSDCTTPGPRLIRRLTSSQYRNTLVDLFQDPGVPEQTVLTDPTVLGFQRDADKAVVSDLDAELLMNYAEQVATWAVEQRIYQISTCTEHNEGCWRGFLEKFGRNAFREPMTEQRIQAYLPLFAAEDTYQAGMAVALTAMLQSPYLLYRRELGEPEQNGEYRLSPFEVASELAYFLTDSAPDNQLLDAALQGRLNSAEQIEQEVNRLIYSEHGRDALAHFVEGWLEIERLPQKAKDETQFDLTMEHRQAMLGETRELFLDVLFSGGTVSDLFTADYTFLNQQLASLYGIANVGSDSLQRVEIAGKRASGLLGHGSFLTAHALPENSSPVQRGVVVRERLLCQELPPVPENLDTNLEPPGAFNTNRQRYEMHSADATCSGCHRLIDPVGFVFEHYDAFGRYREQENGAPIDASGMLSGMPEGDVALSGVASVSSYLAESEAARSCVVRYWTYYAYGRDEWPEKRCTHDAVRRAARESDYQLKDVLLAIVRAPHFTRRVKDQ